MAIRSRFDGAPPTNPDGPGAPSGGAVPSFRDVYDDHFDFVWRTVRRFGIPEEAVADATQEVFIVVHRKLTEFAGRSNVRTWLYSIARRVASDRRRALSPSVAPGLTSGTPDETAAVDSNPEHNSELRIVLALLEELDAEKREVFILAELEQLTIVEISELTGLNVNTAHARLRAARQQFEKAAARLRAREARWGT